MSTWSESVYELNSARGRNLVEQLDDSLYDGISMDDELLEKEAREWAARFPHFRLKGTKCTLHLEDEPKTPTAQLAATSLSNPILSSSAPVKKAFSSRNAVGKDAKKKEEKRGNTTHHFPSLNKKK